MLMTQGAFHLLFLSVRMQIQSLPNPLLFHSRLAGVGESKRSHDITEDTEKSPFHVSSVLQTSFIFSPMKMKRIHSIGLNVGIFLLDTVPEKVELYCLVRVCLKRLLEL